MNKEILKALLAMRLEWGTLSALIQNLATWCMVTHPLRLKLILKKRMIHISKMDQKLDDAIPEKSAHTTQKRSFKERIKDKIKRLEQKN